MNSIGDLFRVSTWGESHGPALGAVIDGCPPGLFLNEALFQTDLDRRKPGLWKTGSSARTEPDQVEILSGVFEGKTLGTPISLMVRNQDARSEDYEKLKDLHRKGHADFTYEAKFGHRDWRGGGRASGRETVARVLGGTVAKQILKGVDISAYIQQVGRIIAPLLN
ncbi:MAG: chorismate synthase, partial [Patescibacteria group bacterium]